MEGLKEANVARETDVYLSNPVLPEEILQGQCVCLKNSVIAKLGDILLFFNYTLHYYSFLNDHNHIFSILIMIMAK